MRLKIIQMRRFFIVFVIFIFPYFIQAQGTWAIAIHGGAGSIHPERMPDSLVADYKKVLTEALDEGISILSSGGLGLDAVERVIRILEDSPLFNAGKGAVFTAKGKNELDASIMDGKTLNAGAVAGVTTVKNPITAARHVMNSSEHVMLAGQGAEEFAKARGIDLVDPSYFYTEHRWKALQRIMNNEKNGTVGCVVLDMQGNLAAGTSTGGMTNKMFGRIGDSPVIGAGTYANNATCAVSCTGHGEYFIRYAVAFDISARMEYLNEPLSKATDALVHQKLKKAGGSGGVIAVDGQGNIATVFNTTGMFRAWATSSTGKNVAIGK